MYAGLIRPTAANADLRPAQMAARSAGSSAARISVAPAFSHSARTAVHSRSTSPCGPSSSTISTAPAPSGYRQLTAASAASIASASIISIAAGRTPAAMMSDTARPPSAVDP